jgi:hypothetical protein
MRSRKVQQAILWAVTIPVTVAGLVMVFVRQNPQPVLWIGGLYLAFLCVFQLCCLKSVACDQRKRPALPPEFARLRLGKTSASLGDWLETGSILDTAEAKEGTHRLLGFEDMSDGGTWTCRIEVRADEILAYSVSFSSKYTPALDRGESLGSGVFFPAAS